MDAELEAIETAAEALPDAPAAVSCAWDEESVDRLFQALAALHVTEVFLLAALLFIAGLVLASIFTRRLVA